MAGEKFLWHFLLFAELFVSSAVHLAYGLVIFGSAVLADLLSGRSIDSAFTVASEAVNPSVATSIDGGIATTDTRDGSDVTPVVLLHGIFGFGKGKLGTISYWAGAEKKYGRVLVPDLGSLTILVFLFFFVSSACELFYFLKGGTVDYGASHSSEYGHARFGRTFEQGHFPEWDEHRPVHFVGHSSGAQVARVLQEMLANKEFPGYENASADWVLSITALSGALNGTTRVYIDGIQPEDGCTLKPLCLLQLLRVGALVYEWLDISYLKNYYSFGFDHYNLQWQKAGLIGLASSIAGYSGPFATGDWILPDLSLQAAARINRKLKTHPNTYYISYATQRTMKVCGKTIPSSLRGIHPLLLLRTLEMCLWRHPGHLSLPFSGYRDADWQDNDGALNTISQLYPRFPFSHPNSLLDSLQGDQPLKRGLWYYTVLEADHIFFIIDRERAGVHFDVLYDSIFERCRKQMVKSTIQAVKDASQALTG
ncbi:uncharacterized protein LOC9636773 isoform X2 [Selaginella moellendorffii]|uniref:uncharacterized protein LOC9636773 isoform X2 n=1 Tax=Selaginella moellendorffii TaxID=88036 RepID=UPI000D1C31B6|nr:uncharacterized protein LOC9636773 isoform X2 [Selaginella moellendorffii]|eukprot:XP_024533504.1 uncharacterized protein LOC9636773 isoform X2 [Selaginella moellendorffii]